MNGSTERTGIPLCVDLDGTLLRTDSTWEAIALLLKHRPLLALLLPLWYLKGKAYLKEQLVQHVVVDVTHFPFNQSLLAFLREQAHHRPLVLVTGASMPTARAVQTHLALFEDVLATGEGVNLTGSTKAQELVRRYGEQRFDYVGNASADLQVWPHARRAIVVNGSKRVHKRAAQLGNLEREFSDHSSALAAFIRAVRPYQWTKNVLLFVPLITSHSLTNSHMLANAVLAFLSFCLCTSSVYVLNDLLDLSSDRQHPRKKYRPLAAGDLPIPIALAGAPLFLLCGIGVALMLPPAFLGVLLAYFVTTFAYSFYLKQLVLIDVLVLAGLYTIRIIAGHAATDIPHSVWLLMFSMFFFLSLALIKRFSEIDAAARANKPALSGRGYTAEDRDQVNILGSASGYISVLVLALYITSDSVLPLYQRPFMLWLLVPLMLLWISRMWLLAHRGRMHDDPIIFALKDSVSYGIGICMAAVMILAT